MAADSPSVDMADEKIRLMAQLEDEHWWFRAKRELVVEILTEHGVRGPVLDVGCGTGATLRRLDEAGFGPALGTDLSPVALDAVGATAIVQARAEDLPVRPASMGALVSLDVVEHLDDDVVALREYGRVVRPGGLVVLAVPAYMWAWSEHDEVLGHRRRYSREGVEQVVVRAGLELVGSTHFHSWLAPVAYVVRRTPVGRLVRSSQEEASLGSPFVNRTLERLSDGERRLSRWRPIPFGLSILVVARRPPAPVP